MFDDGVLRQRLKAAGDCLAACGAAGSRTLSRLSCRPVFFCNLGATMPGNLGSGLLLGVLVITLGFTSRLVTISPQLAPALTLLFGVSGVIADLYLFLRGFRLLHQKKWIEDTPVAKIGAAAMGQVKVFGKVTGPYTLLSPLAGTDCYYYRAVAWSGGESRYESVPGGRATETLFAPFFVEDESGRVMVDPRGAQIELPADFDEQIAGDSMDEASRRFLRRRGLSTHSVTCVTEYSIKPGDSLQVLGTLAENRDWGNMASAEPGELAAEERYLSPEAANLQRREQLEAMGVPDRELPTADSRVAPGFELHARVVLRKGDDGHPLVLSRQNPQGLIDDLRRRSVIGIWGGAALTLIGLGLVVQWLGIW